jgi:Rod binding domain-containing protein
MENTIIGSIPTVSSQRDPGTPGTLREATQEFESLFIAQLMKSMRGSVPQSKLMGSDSGPGMFREMLDQELSRQIAFAGGFGIGDILYQQLKGK